MIHPKHLHVLGSQVKGQIVGSCKLKYRKPLYLLTEPNQSFLSLIVDVKPPTNRQHKLNLLAIAT